MIKITRKVLGKYGTLALFIFSLAVPGAPAALAAASTMTAGVASPPVSMDPQAREVSSTMSILTNIFGTLLQRNAQGKLVPDLATSWKRVNAKTWRFHLRKGVKFQNGNKFTWQDVQFTLKRLNSPKISAFINVGSLIASVKPVNGNSSIIDIKTTKPVPFLAQMLPEIFIMDKQSTQSRSQGKVGLHPIGTGPYQLVKWVKGSYIKLKANKNYWGQQPAIKQVTIKPITEPSTRMAAISSGQIDLLQGVPVMLAKAIKRNPKVKLVSRPGRRVIFLGLTNRPGSPTADMRVRKAMYMAINEKAIINKVMFGHAKPAAQIPDPATTGYSKTSKRLPYNLQKAKALLKKAGYSNGFKITLTGPNNRYVQDKQIEATVASQLAKIGIKVNVNSIPQAIYFPKVDQHNLAFYLLGWSAATYDFGRTYNELVHTVNAQKGYGASNGDGYSNPQLDKQYAKANQLINPKKRARALQRLNEMTMKQIAVIPLHYQEDDYAIYKGCGVHFKPRADTWLVFKDMSVSAQ
jgi:peptide/nickel transport system substrate-binding protein